MLKKLTKRGTEDISNLKLYWDTEKKQIRHKAHCEYCGVDIGCMCYETTHEALEGLDSSFVCNKCHIKAAIDMDLTLEDIINNLTNETTKKVRDFVLDNMTEEDRKKVMQYIECLPSYDDCADFYGRPCKV